MYPRRALAFGIVFLALGLAAVVAADPRKEKPKLPADDKSSNEDVNNLSMEVDALTAVREFQLNKAQLEALGKLAAETAGKGDNRQPAKASDKYRKVLADLRDALRGDDEDAIDERSDAVDELRDKENPELDDAVELTDAARKQTPAYLALLTPRQVAAYIAGLDDEDLDGPLERLSAALEQSRKLNGNDWNDARDDTAEAVGWLVAGLDAAASAKVAGQAKDLLDRVHALKEAEFKAQRDDLDKEAKQLAGDVGPTEVLRRIVEHPLAELLSNPRLAAAVEARLKTAK